MKHRTYRYLSHIQVCNHCMSKYCTECKFYFDWDSSIENKECFLDRADWEDIKDGPGRFINVKSDELAIFNTLLLTDEVDDKGNDICDNECSKCKYGVLTYNSSSYSCAPFISTRTLCRKIKDYREEG